MGTRAEPNAAEAPSRGAFARFGPLVFLCIAVIELIAHGVMRSRVPRREEWDAAASFVRAHVRDRDVVVAAPDWSDPLVRLAVGDTMSFAEAGYSDLAGFERLWALSIRGHLPADAPDAPPAVERRFGEVQVLRWDLGPSSVVYDFVDHVRDAEVAIGAGPNAHACPFVTTSPRGGALGAGAYVPASRFVCDPRSPGHWVGETVTEDLELRPRRCIQQRPDRGRPVRATFRDVPAGSRLVLYAGLYYEDERNLEGEPFTLLVRRDGAEIGRLAHRDGEGWKRVEIPLDERSAVPSTFTFESDSASSQRRSVCWAATVRGPEREEAE